MRRRVAYRAKRVVVRNARYTKIQFMPYRVLRLNSPKPEAKVRRFLERPFDLHTEKM